jgi:ankyrin repeat protein
MYDVLDLTTQAASLGHHGAQLVSYRLKTRLPTSSLDSGEAVKILEDYNQKNETALNSAIIAGDLGRVRKLLDNNIAAWVKNSQGLDPIVIALKTHSLDGLRLLLRYTKVHPEKLLDFNEILPFLTGKLTSPFALLMYSNSQTEDFVFPALDLLREAGVKIDETGILCQAVEDDNVPIAEYYIKKLQLDIGKRWEPYSFILLSSDKIDIDIKLESFLQTAIMNCKPAMVDMILNFIGVVESSISPDGGTFLGNLSTRLSLADDELNHIATSLVLHGADVTVVDSRSNGPLYEAVKAKRLTAVQAMLRLGASMEDSYRAFYLCLHDSYSQISPAILNDIIAARPEVLSFSSPRTSFLSRTMDLKARDANYLRFLCQAEEMERDDVIVTKKLKTIIAALEKLPGGDKTLRALLDDQSDGIDLSPLHAAAFSGNIQAAGVLLAKKANVNQSTSLSTPGWSTDLDATLAAILSSVPDQQLLSDPSLSIDLDAELSSILSLGIGIREPSRNEMLEDKTPSDLVEISDSKLPNGLTPLDSAFGRSWEVKQRSLQNSKMGALMREIEWAGGNQTERRYFEQRTVGMIELLKSHGGKRASELMNLP